MRSRIALLLVLLLLTSSRGLEAQADGAWSVAGLEAVREFTDSIGTAAFLLMSNGTVVASWGDVSRPFRVHSIRKSLLSALIGVALERGELDLDTTLDGLGINDRELLTDLERSATTLQLLQSRSGVYHPAASETAEARSTRPRRGSHAPGSHWYYNNWDFNALGTIYASARGQTVGDAFRDWIARPLGMQDYDEDRDFATSWSRTSPDIPPTSSDCLPGTWPGSVSSFFSGGSGTVRPWSPRPGSPRAPGSTRTRTSSGTKSGYGLMWWVVATGRAQIPAGSFTASGSGGQRLTVIPEFQTVVVHLMDTDAEGGSRIGTSTYDALLRRLMQARVPAGGG